MNIRWVIVDPGEEVQCQTGASTPPSQRLHIAYSTYFSKIYKCTHIFSFFFVFLASPTLTMMHLHIMHKTYLSVLVWHRRRLLVSDPRTNHWEGYTLLSCCSLLLNCCVVKGDVERSVEQREWRPGALKVVWQRLRREPRVRSGQPVEHILPIWDLGMQLERCVEECRNLSKSRSCIAGQSHKCKKQIFLLFKNACFNVFIFWTIFYFLVEFFILLNPLNSYIKRLLSDGSYRKFSYEDSYIKRLLSDGSYRKFSYEEP